MRQPESRSFESRMRWVALIVSLVALGLMAAGYLDLLLGKQPLRLPGEAVLPIPALLRPSLGRLGLFAMSLGVVLLAVLPAMRVALTLGLRLRARQLVEALLALLVLSQLVIGVLLGA